MTDERIIARERDALTRYLDEQPRRIDPDDSKVEATIIADRFVLIDRGTLPSVDPGDVENLMPRDLWDHARALIARAYALEQHHREHESAPRGDGR